MFQTCTKCSWMAPTLGDDVLEGAAAGDHGQHVLQGDNGSGKDARVSQFLGWAAQPGRCLILSGICHSGTPLPPTKPPHLDVRHHDVEQVGARRVEHLPDRRPAGRERYWEASQAQMKNGSNTQRKQRAMCRASPDRRCAGRRAVQHETSPCGHLHTLWGPADSCGSSAATASCAAGCGKPPAGTSRGLTSSPQLRGVLHALGRHVERRGHLRDKGRGRAGGLMRHLVAVEVRCRVVQLMHRSVVCAGAAPW